MLRYAVVISVIAVTVLCAGCTVSPATAHDAWVHGKGGLLLDHRLTAASAALCRLHTDNIPPATIHVLDSSAAGAFAWADGSIYVTRGLVDLLSEDELSAAIAHELGHLLADSVARHPVALPGADSGEIDTESQADRLACGILRSSGLDAGNLARVLAKLSADRSLTSTCRETLRLRITRLSAQ